MPVPDSTIDHWTHPPFSGHYDSTYIWGRGSEDDKSNLIAKSSALDALLLGDFVPRRTIIVAVRFDEEEGNESCPYGAKGLAQEIERRFGRDEVEVIVSSSNVFVIKLIKNINSQVFSLVTL